MLRKLLKYEFRATARVMLPLYLVVIVLALLTRGASLWTQQVTFYGLGEGLLGVLAALIAVGFILALLATFVVAVVLAVVRFRNNLLTDEGYVMFTLPVSPPQPGVFQAHRLGGVVFGGGGHRRGGPDLPGGRRGHVPGDGPGGPGDL